MAETQILLKIPTDLHTGRVEFGIEHRICFKAKGFTVYSGHTHGLSCRIRSVQKQWN